MTRKITFKKSFYKDKNGTEIWQGNKLSGVLGITQWEARIIDGAWYAVTLQPDMYCDPDKNGRHLLAQVCNKLEVVDDRVIA